MPVFFILTLIVLAVIVGILGLFAIELIVQWQHSTWKGVCGVLILFGINQVFFGD